MDTYTQTYANIPISASILVNTVGYVLNECKELKKKSDVYHYSIRFVHSVLK